MNRDDTEESDGVETIGLHRGFAPVFSELPLGSREFAVGPAILRFFIRVRARKTSPLIVKLDWFNDHMQVRPAPGALGPFC